MTLKRALTIAGLAAAVAFTTAPAAHAEGLFRALLGGFGDIQPAGPGIERGGSLPYKYQRQRVRYSGPERPGTIVIDTEAKYLYLVEEDGRALRYGVGVGREGFGWRGAVKVGRKAEWPGWTPPAEMRRREAKKGRDLPAYMEGGPGNPLGARAMYLYDGGRDTMFRIHGTSEPWTIGHNVSSGCIRMVNADVADLYERVGVGTRVIVR